MRYSGPLPCESLARKHETGSATHNRTRPRRTFIIGLVLLALLPMALSPTRPIAVYGYLAARYIPGILPNVHADAPDELDEFLVAQEQVDRYREDLLADMAESQSGRLFAVVRSPDKRLEVAPIRTWNTFLPHTLPPALKAWLDRKEFPFLADQVALWQQGRTIVAMGHYHVYGGGPSSGDLLAQEFSELPEVVVSNGIVPIVYLRGALLAYGGNMTVSREVFRKMRALDRALMMEIRDVPVNATQPSAALVSFLAYLRDRRGVDASSLPHVAWEINRLSTEFKADYAAYFEAGYGPMYYVNNHDQVNLLTNLSALVSWATSIAESNPNLDQTSRM